MKLVRWIHVALLALVFSLLAGPAGAAPEVAPEGERVGPSQDLLSINGLGRVRLKSTVKHARRSGYFVRGARLCGGPLLKPRFGSTIVVAGRGRILGVEAYSDSKIRTRSGIGPGSRVRRLRARHPRLVKPRTVRTSGGRGWVQFLKQGDRRLVFLYDTPVRRKPRGSDKVTVMMLSVGWKPSYGLFSAC